MDMETTKNLLASIAAGEQKLKNDMKKVTELKKNKVPIHENVYFAQQSLK